MNLTEYIYLINKPEAIHEKQTAVLEKIVQEFPYFQSARALYLKGLYNQNSFKYNYVLKVTAAHTCDRSVLFDFITSDTFTSVNRGLLDQKLRAIEAIPVADSEVVEHKLEVRENTIEQSILSSIEKAGQEPEPSDIPAEIASEIEPMVLSKAADEEDDWKDPTAIEVVETLEIEAPKEFVFEPVADVPVVSSPEEEIVIHAPEIDQPAQNLELGKPLAFARDERHSFQEWLQLSQFKPIDRNQPEPTPDSEPSADESTFSDSDLEKQKKNELIDRFIETSPRIPPVKHDAPLTASMIVEPSMDDKTFLMTETLARVYLEQKKYNKAIQAYEILILKYPEKSSFFADRILDIKNLQQNNK
ncbi:tetratricopeptide repeat protein [Flavobacterium caeni]|uniref:Tetratricopeptide repeat-containing protein n=1 Tax=Flavobacterium caeni TaxID=490189 RepID=A0A1G5I3R5_9FLAO|nr:tetratricopeptide repeat protein [Flavobacterium caeni]SCY70279.1 hypothetical protein SAMN02927903_02061 [Flavobacterium caeni]